MSTPGGLVDKQELIDAQLDTAHLGRVVNSKDASGNPIDTSTNRTGGVNKTLDALETEYLEAIQGAGGVSVGTWTAGVTTFNAYNEYAVYNGIPYKPRTSATLPYVAQGADPTTAPDDANVQPYQEITEAQVVTLVEETIPEYVSGENLIPNSDFSIAGSVANPPDTTPRSYSVNDELFQGFKAAGALSGVTYVNGKLNGTGQLYVDVYKTEKQNLSTVTHIASIASSDGVPVESGASFVDSGDYWRVTFDMSETFSVKLESGSSSTKHDTGEGVSDKASDVNSPYVITTKKNELQRAVDEAVKRKYDDYKQINDASNSGSVVIDLGGQAGLIDRPIELPAGAGGYTFKNGLIAPNPANFPVGESLIEYSGSGDHPLIGYENLQLECARIANGMYVNQYIENWASGLRIHGQRDWGIRIGSDLGFEFNMAPGCTIAEYYNNETGFLNPTSTGLLIDVGGAADNKFNALVVKYCKRQFDIGSQANKFTSCHFYGTGTDQYNSNGRSIIRGNAKRNQFNGTYLDTCGLEIQNPSQMQFLGGRLAAASSVDASSYVFLNAITSNHNMDAFLFKDNIFSIIGDYQADAFSWQGTLGRIRDSEVCNNSVDLQGAVGESPSIKMHSTKAYRRVSGNGVNSITADFTDVLLWDSPIQRLIDSEVEFGNNLQPHSTDFNGLNVTTTLPSGEFSNITLRTSVDNSSRYSVFSDQYPL